MTLHGRCQVFRGYKSKDFSQLLFSVKRSSMIPSGMVNLEVFLANNQRESACDFRVNVCRDKRSCTVYAGESPRIVATVCTALILVCFIYTQAHNTHKLKCLFYIAELGN